MQSQFWMSWQNLASGKLNVRQWIHEDIKKTEGILQNALSEQSFFLCSFKGTVKVIAIRFAPAPSGVQCFNNKDNAVSSYITQLLAEAAFIQTEP